MYKQRVILLNLTLLNVRIVFLFCAFVHLVVTAVVTLNIDTTVDEDPKVRAYYYTRWKLITCWFNLITLAYLPARLYVDWKISQGEGRATLVKHFEHATDVIMTGLLFPVVLLSDGLFWLIYNKNPGWLGASHIFDYLPNWAQHSLHTVSFVVIVLDLLLTPRQRPKTLKPRIALLMAFSFAYSLIIMFDFRVSFYYARGEMVYPVLEILNAVQLIVIGVVLLTICLLLFAAQWVAIAYLWGTKTNQITKVSMKKIL